jgi:hypothetical protein
MTRTLIHQHFLLTISMSPGPEACGWGQEVAR